MTYQPPEKVRTLEPYQPVEGEFRIRMDANESPLSLPDELQEELARRLRDSNLNRYPDPSASECRELAAKWFGVRPEEIVVGNGSDELIMLIQNCLLSRGDAILTLEPDFSMYSFYSHLAELRHTAVGKNPDWAIDVDRVLEAAQTEAASMILFSNPCNPTSLLLPHEQVERLVRESGALVVVDEAYMDFAGDSVLDLVGRVPNLLILKTCSKAVGLAGARVGFAVGSETLIRCLHASRSPYNVGTLPQAAASVLLSHTDYLDGCAQRLREWTNHLFRELHNLEEEFCKPFRLVSPSRTNFVLLETPDARALWESLRNRGVAVRLLDGFLRISTGTPEENADFLKIFRKILNQRGKEARQ